MADTKRRRGRPPGPSSGRGPRHWDPVHVSPEVIIYVAANPDLPRYRIAEALQISPSELSRITCSPEGATLLDYYKRHPHPGLQKFKLTP